MVNLIAKTRSKARKRNLEASSIDAKILTASWSRLKMNILKSIKANYTVVRIPYIV